MKPIQFSKVLWNLTFGRFFAGILIGLIRSYQILLSPRIGQVCRYYPTCSHYGLAAIKTHGAGKGSLLTAWRVMRCHPWAAGGIEYVPAKGSWNNLKVIETSTNNDRQVIGA
ncbi:MAG: membrane protein insertion efficiency factor YidD [Actinobacteria bacterium]|nr:membrane protein insertion efficiency factor YidD [Actinomycetota bacterium]